MLIKLQFPIIVNLVRALMLLTQGLIFKYASPHTQHRTILLWKVDFGIRDVSPPAHPTCNFHLINAIDLRAVWALRKSPTIASFQNQFGFAVGKRHLRPAIDSHTHRAVKNSSELRELLGRLTRRCCLRRKNASLAGHRTAWLRYASSYLPQNFYTSFSFFWSYQ